MLRLWQIPHSTNVLRVEMALAHKGLTAEPVMADPTDRSAIVAVSGQPLVPVLEDGDVVIHDSLRILRHLEERFPEPPLYPREPARRAELLVVLDWFDRVWKRPPNAIADHGPDPVLSRELRESLDVFEDLLDNRPYLFGDELSAADCAAFPFLRYGLGCPPGDDDPFHHVLAAHLHPAGHPRVGAWLERVAGHLP